jgi:DNA modification methylase
VLSYTDKQRYMAIESRIRREKQERSDAIDAWVNQNHVGDVREIVPRIPSKSVRLIFFSPPYFQARDFGTAIWTGGKIGCDHVANRRATLKRGQGFNVGGSRLEATKVPGYQYRDICARCGARCVDKQLGLEKTVAEFVRHLVVDVGRELRRILTDDGTLWPNIGDCYADGTLGRGDTLRLYGTDHDRLAPRPRKAPAGTKPKDRLGVPWATAFGYRDDGWYLRSEIILAKTAPIPEPAKDRPTGSHEQLFLLSKSRRYYYNGDAVREPYAEASLARYNLALQGTSPGARKPGGDIERREREKRIRTPNPLGRNLRTVWPVSPQRFHGDHYVVMPESVAERVILAASQPGDIVFDPFSGAGTTLVVAKRLGRRWIGIDLNPSYVADARRRVSATQRAEPKK